MWFKDSMSTAQLIPIYNTTVHKNKVGNVTLNVAKDTNRPQGRNK